MEPKSAFIRVKADMAEIVEVALAIRTCLQERGWSVVEHSSPYPADREQGNDQGRVFLTLVKLNEVAK
jgi:hypothetical protein